MSGYAAARSDFAVEHNNFAELDIRDIMLTENDGSLDAGTVLKTMILLVANLSTCVCCMLVSVSSS